MKRRSGGGEKTHDNAGKTRPQLLVQAPHLSFFFFKQKTAYEMDGCLEFRRVLFRSQGGRIINNGSISAHVPRPHAVAYTATKHAITGLTKSISLEGRPFNIACGQIDIGNAATDLTSNIERGTLQATGALMVEPMMSVSNAAQAVVFMAGLPLDANVEFLTVMATNMPYIGRG